MLRIPFLLFLLLFSVPTLANPLETDPVRTPPAGVPVEKGWVSGMTAQQLQSYCAQTVRAFEKKPEKSDDYATFCLGFLQGFTDGFAMARETGVSFCLPQETKGSDLAQVFVKEMETRPPAEFSLNAVSILTAILHKTYPCPGPPQ